MPKRTSSGMRSLTMKYPARLPLSLRLEVDQPLLSLLPLFSQRQQPPANQKSRYQKPSHGSLMMKTRTLRAKPVTMLLVNAVELPVVPQTALRKLKRAKRARMRIGSRCRCSWNYLFRGWRCIDSLWVWQPSILALLIMASQFK
jgi:hypothetical protein